MALGHFTPLRYPGGKGKLASFVKKIVLQNGLSDGRYVEPYAGGAAVGLELLLGHYVQEIHINDLSLPVFSFWHSALTRPDELCAMIENASLTVENWDRQKATFRRLSSTTDDLELLQLGFATFFLNRTNRSGILNGGIIGGRSQQGNWKIDARYNAVELIARIQAIARNRARIILSRDDALQVLGKYDGNQGTKTLIYLDPPYYVKGSQLYYDSYQHSDHVAVAGHVQRLTNVSWLVSYDNVEEIRTLYKESTRIEYTIGYSARKAARGSEVMFFSDDLVIPELSGSMLPHNLALVA